MIGVKIMNKLTQRDFTNYLKLSKKLPFNRIQKIIILYLFSDVPH